MNIPPGSLEIERDQTLAWLKDDEFADWSDDVKLLLDNSPTNEVEQLLLLPASCYRLPTYYLLLTTYCQPDNTSD